MTSVDDLPAPTAALEVPGKVRLPRAERPRWKIRKWIMTGVLVPILTAGIGSGATIAVPNIEGSSPAATATSQTMCSQYEQYVIAPLAKTDPNFAEKLLESGSAVDHACGLGG
jgi:hypothetical protein